MSMVLVVDDNLDACHMLARLIRRVNGDAACATSGDEALEFLRDHHVDLMILDVMMPGMDGLEVLRRVRADPATARLPVVMFSAVADPLCKLRAFERGANDYWLKASQDFSSLKDHIVRLLKSAPEA
jgi:two-component system cell cycle response regulator